MFYQIYPRSFADSDGDGVGDLDGVAARLDYLDMLGVDAIWLNPVTVSPMADHGYDVADPRDVDPLFGGIEALDRLDRRGAPARHQGHDGPGPQPHQLSCTPGFRRRCPPVPACRAGALHLPRRRRCRRRRAAKQLGVGVRRSGLDRVTEPDGNPGQWYLHLFDAEQPDLNWDNPEVFDDFEKTLRFWLDRGVDGFRIDVAHGMAKPPGLPDMEDPEPLLLLNNDDDPRFNYAGVHAFTDRFARCSTTTPKRSRSARCGCATTNASPNTYAPTSCTWASISGCCRPISMRPKSARPSTTRWPPWRSKAPRPPGRWPTTMSNASRPATAAAQPGSRGPVRWRW